MFFSKTGDLPEFSGPTRQGHGAMGTTNKLQMQANRHEKTSIHQYMSNMSNIQENYCFQGNWHTSWRNSMKLTRFKMPTGCVKMRSQKYIRWLASGIIEKKILAQRGLQAPQHTNKWHGFAAQGTTWCKLLLGYEQFSQLYSIHWSLTL